MYIPSEHLSIKWYDDFKGIDLLLPWMIMSIEIDDQEKYWVREAIDNLHNKPSLASVQKFLKSLNMYPIAYKAPRLVEEIQDPDLQPPPDTLDHLDTTTPTTFLTSLNIPLSQQYYDWAPKKWSWDVAAILNKSQIPNTNLYDPVSVVTYLILYRLNWERDTWSGQDRLVQGLENLLQKDEQKFFHIMGWISRQSHYVTKQFHVSVLPALEHFPKARKEIEHFITDEVGHYKFMEQTLEALGFKSIESVEVEEVTRWMLDVFEEMGKISPLAFSAMVNIFEAAYYEGEDPLSRVLKKSSKPEAARGYDLHYKINQEHRHCDMPIIFSSRCGPQPKSHVALTVHLFEITLYFLDKMEEKALLDMNSS